MMSEDKQRIEGCMTVNGYKGHVVSFYQSLIMRSFYRVHWSDGKIYLINIDRFTVDEIGVDHVGED